MATKPTPFARAIEEFIAEKKSNEDKNSAFYQEILSKINTTSTGSFRRDDSDDSKAWADSLSALVTTLERDSRTQRKGRRFVERLGKACAGFNQYAGAFDVLIQAAPAAAVLIYGGARLLLQLSQKVYECYETVVDILEDISTHIQCFHAFSQAYDASEHVQKQLVKSYKLIINFWMKASKLLTGHTLTKLFSRNTQLSREWKNYCGDLHRCKDQVCLAVEAAKADLTRQKALQDQVYAREKERKDTMDSVVSWIRGNEDDSKLHFRHVIREKLSLRHHDTCDWLLENPDFQSWRVSTKTTSLWLSSQPGTGKSVLASHVAQTLENQKMNVVSYFFSFNDLAQKTATTAFRSLALQLLATYQAVPDNVLRIFSTEARSSKLDNMETTTQLLQALVKQINRVHIIVDGLDECEDRSRLLRHLPQVLGTKTHGIVKWLFTSRPEKEFRDFLPAHGVGELQIPKEKLLQDVRKFMEYGIRSRIGVECQDYMDHWVDESNGNFLWAYLTLQILEGEGLTCEAEIEDALEKFPKGLEGCYERSLSLLVREKKKAEWMLAQKVFKLMVAAVQPLRLSEVSHAIGALSADDQYNPKRIPRPALIEVLCSGLVDFDRTVKDGKTDPVLKFCHKSVRDFLVEDPKALDVSDAVAGFFVTDEDAQLLLGEACLRYLSFSRYLYPQDTVAILTEDSHAFLRYAAAFWQHHLSDSQHSRTLYKQVLSFAQSPCFWNTLAIQSRIVPHLFALYYEMESGGFNYHIDDVRRDQVLDVAYGSPLPLWMDDTTYGPEGKELVKRVHAWVQQWHSVLNSQPAAISQCIMETGWEAHFQSRDAWRSDRLTSYSLVPSDTGREALDMKSFEIATVERSSCHSQLLVKLRCQTDELEWNIDVERHAACVIDQQQRKPLPTSTGDCSDACNIRQVDGSLISLRLDTLTVLTISPNGMQDGMITHQSTHSPEEAWHIRSISGASGTKLGENSLEIYGIYCSSDPPKPERRMQDRDSGFFEDSGDDTSSISSDSMESDLKDIVEDDSRNRCMLIVRPSGPPIWSFWRQQSGLDDIRCAIGQNHQIAIWSTKESEACAVNLTTGQFHKIYFPESSENCTPHWAYHREFYFSRDETTLYYLRYTAVEKDLGVEQRLAVIALKFSMEGGVPLLTRTGVSCNLDYAIAGNLQWPTLLRDWTDEHLYVALPCLSCDPKFLRLSLSGLSADETPSFDTLRDPIYFPSNTADRSPTLRVFDESDDKTQLVLTMNSIKAGNSSKALGQPPTVMVWKINSNVDWRQWDDKLDSCSEQYKRAEDSCNRLRGNFVDPSQRFLVPIRSGLDWTKKAFVACL